MSLAFATTITRAFPGPVLRLARTVRRPSHWQSSAVTPETARAKIASENVMVFATSYCPYCARVKSLFDDLNISYCAWDMDQMAEGPDIRRFLAEETGQTSVPNVFISGRHIGGCDDCIELHFQDKLLDMVNATKK